VYSDLLDSQTHINGNSSKIEYLAERVIQAEMIAKKTHLNETKKKMQSKLGC
jgi:hypothetical protein